MQTLNKKDWYSKLYWLKSVKERYHEDFEVDKQLADLYYTLAEMNVWELPKMLYRGYLLERYKNLHKSCCNID